MRKRGRRYNPNTTARPAATTASQAKEQNPDRTKPQCSPDFWLRGLVELPLGPHVKALGREHEAGDLRVRHVQGVAQMHDAELAVGRILRFHATALETGMDFKQWKT